MKVCPTCNEIVFGAQDCKRSDCPNLSASAAPVAKVEPGATGRADKAVQQGLDRLGDGARESSRRALFALVATGFLVLFVALYAFKGHKVEDVTVTVTEEAEVRDVASNQGSKVLYTLMPGTELKGHWVSGVTSPSEQWLEFEGSSATGYIPRSKLSASESTPADINVSSPVNCSGYYVYVPSNPEDEVGISVRILKKTIKIQFSDWVSMSGGIISENSGKLFFSPEGNGKFTVLCQGQSIKLIFPENWKKSDILLEKADGDIFSEYSRRGISYGD